MTAGGRPRPTTAVSLVAAVAVFTAPPAAAQYAEIDQAIARVTAEITEIRHRIHQNPELSNREHETARLVADYLRKLRFDRVDTGVARTGVVGLLRGGRPGPVVAVRADMDALPVKEDTPYPWKSTKTATWRGEEVPVSHACGHDVHTAVLLGVADALASVRERLPGTVKFIFQPAEEGPPPGEEGGAPLMIAEGVLEDPLPEAIFGFHTYAQLEVGKIGYTPGGALAAVDHFYVTITGKQAHGAAPHLSVDPVVIASEAILALQTIRSRKLPPLAPSVVTVGMIRGGTRFNIIPGEVKLEGTVRTYDPAVQDQVERRIREILAGVTAAHGATFELRYDRVTPATINDTVLTARSVPSLERAVGSGNVSRIDPWMAGEDFAYFANEMPGFYFRLGTLKPGTTSGDHHSPTFLADDSAIPVGIKAMSYLLVDYVRSGR